MPEPENKKRKIKAPKKITARYLDNAAAFYLGRYASSSANLKRILMKRATKSCAFHETPLHEAIQLIDDLVLRYIESGFLDDERYAYNLARSLRNKGKSRRQIAQRMYEKGVDETVFSPALQAVDKEIADEDSGFDPETLAAWRLAKRRKLGPYRLPEHRQDFWQKDLGSFARAGFSYEIANRILEQDDIPEEIEDILR